MEVGEERSDDGLFLKGRRKRRRDWETEDNMLGKMKTKTKTKREKSGRGGGGDYERAEEKRVVAEMVGICWIYK